MPLETAREHTAAESAPQPNLTTTFLMPKAQRIFTTEEPMSMEFERRKTERSQFNREIRKHAKMNAAVTELKASVNPSR